MDVNLMSSATPLSKIPISGMYADVQSRTRQTRQEQERNVQQVAQIANSQKNDLENAVAKNDRINGQESAGLYTQARQQESQQQQKFMSKIDIFA